MQLLGIMDQVLCIFLATHLFLRLEALPCQEWEYEINRECCPKCGPGYRVSRNCTISSSTSCVPCAEGTYTEHPNGLRECFRCRECDPGAHLKVREKCTYTTNAMCGCEPGHFCTYLHDTSCEICVKHTVSPPGFMVIQAGTEMSDTKFVPCPRGTFSKTEMSFSCEPWTNCSEKGFMEVQPGNASSDAVCDQPREPHNIVLLAIVSVIAFLLFAAGVVLVVLWRRKRCFGKGAAGKQKEEQNRGYIPVQESNNPAIPMQETTQNHGEPSYCMHA